MQKYIFLVEIGTEELPSKILKRLGCDFANYISNEFKKNDDINCIDIDWFVSPRHLAVKSKIRISNVDIIASIKELDKCNIQNVLRMTGVSNNQNEILDFDTKEKYRYVKHIDQSNSVHHLLCGIVNSALEKLKNYEMMRWGGVEAFFIRPVRNVTILLDTYLIRGCFFGVNTNRILYGHQLIQNNKIVINHANDYPSILLEKGQVIVDYNKRKEIIYLGVKEEAKKFGGFVNMENSSLLDEVTSLVEWPVVLSGKFDEKFLDLPSEVIHYIMQHDYKYFPVYNAIDGILLPCFIFVANVFTNNYKQIIIDYENVIKPRLMDAEFFFKKDDQYTLEDYISKLDSVLFHRELGSLRDKSNRISELSGWIAAKIGEDIEQAKRAGYLCKCDLVSSMVFEFPIVQGIIGMYYARRDGESEQIALAQKEHYNPRFVTDILPTTRISCAVALADRIDTISGMFGIKEFPKGDRDPFALKRSAFGILRILIQKKISLNLFDLIEESIKLYQSKLTNMAVIRDIRLFMYKRLYLWYSAQNFKRDIIRSVLAVGYYDVLNVDMRMHAVSAFSALHRKDNILKLYFIYKRISSIIMDKQMLFCEDFKNRLLEIPAEVRLASQFFLVEEKINVFLKSDEYYKALLLLVTMVDPVQIFFDKVIVIAENKEVRKNRLILLNKIKNLFLRIMDISLLQV